MNIYKFNNKIYDLQKLIKNVLPQLLKLLDYIENSNQDYFSKDELINIYKTK